MSNFNNSNEVIKAIMKGAVATRMSNYCFELGNAKFIYIEGVTFKIFVAGQETNYGTSAEGTLLAEKLVANCTTAPSSPKARINRTNNTIVGEYGNTQVTITIHNSSMWGACIHVEIRGDKAVGEQLVALATKKWNLPTSRV